MTKYFPKIMKYRYSSLFKSSLCCHFIFWKDLRCFCFASLVAQTVKCLFTMRETRVRSLVWEDLLGKKMATHSIFLPGKSHGWRSLVGCSPWDREELDSTERLPFHFSLSCIGEGNGNPLQSSCLENPRDSGAWWAAVCGVAQSRT